MGESSEQPLSDPEHVGARPKIIGVIGPHAIGKDEVISALENSLTGDIRMFSIGNYIADNLIDQPEEVRGGFIQRVIDSGIESEDARLNVIRGKQLVDEIEHNYRNHLPIPQEVADWLLQDFLTTCSPETIVFMSGGPYSELDLEFMEQHNPPSALIFLAPTSSEWWKEIPRREKERGRKGPDLKEYNPELEWEKWKHRAAEVLKHAHKKGYPVMHVSMRNPKLNKQEVNNQLIRGLSIFVNDIKEGKEQPHLQRLDVE